MKASKNSIKLLLLGILLISFCFPCCSCDSDNGQGTQDGTDYDPSNDGFEGRDGILPDWLTENSPDSEICGEEEFNINQVTPDMLIILDRSNSMHYNGFWDPTRDAVVNIAMTYQNSVLFGLMVFPDLSCVNGMPSQCNPGRTPIVEVALNNGESIQSALSFMDTCGGTPIAQTLVNAHNYLIGLTDTNPKYILLATDGAPNCNNSLDGSTCRCTCTDPSVCAPCTELSSNCLDDTGTYDAIDDLYDDGIKTFVIGMSTAAEEWGDVLSAMARHGGTDALYPAEDPAQLEDVFDRITGMIATCEFDLNPSDAADPHKVNFYFDGVVVPMDSNNENGWNWVDDDTIRFYGSYCDQIMNGDVNTISAKYGCPTIMI